MESVEKFIEDLAQSRALREEKFAKLREQQALEYKEFTEKLEMLKEDTTRSKENITKNLQILTANEDSIYKLVHDSKNISGLPIPHTLHKEGTAFFVEGVEFVSNLGNTQQSLFPSIEANNVDTTDIIDSITCCTNAMGNELCNVRSTIAQAEKLKRNGDILQEHSLDINDGIKNIEDTVIT